MLTHNYRLGLRTASTSPVGRGAPAASQAVSPRWEPGRDFRRRGLGLLLACALARVFFSSASAATPPTEAVALPACGPNPNVNTLTLQAAIDTAPSGSTLILPSGVCVLAKCEMAQGSVCYGVSGRHHSALYIGNKSDLTLEGAADGTSVLKLDPNPPSSPGQHAYCGPAHVLTIQLSMGITLRSFTVDGSDGELPHDNEQCLPNPKLGVHFGEINEHLHGVRVLNATDITIDSMQLTGAHGDGLNLMADRPKTSTSPEAQIPFTERVSVTASDFLGNDRSGIAFQRNVGFVTIRKNTSTTAATIRIWTWSRQGTRRTLVRTRWTLTTISSSVSRHT